MDEEPKTRVIMHAARCGHHHDPACQSCVNAQSTTNAEIDDLHKQISALQKEVDEQCRLLGAGSEREASQLGEITRLRRQVEWLKVDVETQEALQVSAYKAGVSLGWNLGVSDDNEGLRRALDGTEHVAKLRQIREARTKLRMSEA